jgi:hypothetical protein
MGDMTTGHNKIAVAYTCGHLSGYGSMNLSELTDDVPISDHDTRVIRKMADTLWIRPNTGVRTDSIGRSNNRATSNKAMGQDRVVRTNLYGPLNNTIRPDYACRVDRSLGIDDG